MSPHVGLVVSVTWMKNCSTIVYATVLQDADMITFQEKNPAPAEHWCHSSLLTLEGRVDPLGMANFYPVQKFCSGKAEPGKAVEHHHSLGQQLT